MSHACHKIISVNTTDTGGGAEQVARDLFEGYRRQGRESWLLVGDKNTNDPGVMPFWQSPHLDYTPYSRWWAGVQLRLQKWLAWQRGHEDHCHPYSHHLPKITGSRPDVVHMHNLHGGYFDLRAINMLRKKFQVVWTLHDCWAFSGHCAYPVNCERWKIGCGSCPDLTLYPALKRDGTRANWKLKRELFKKTRLHIAAGSQWMLDRVPGSILEPMAVETRLIRYGIDLVVFRPGSKEESRRALGLPADEIVLAAAATRISSNPYKDCATLRKAAAIVAGHLPQRRVRLLLLGDAQPEEKTGHLTIEGRAFLRSRVDVATVFRASDVMLHAAHEEVFGLVVAEALACGTPVVATAVGGIPEIFRHEQEGMLVPHADPGRMAEAVITLLSSPERLKTMGDSAAKHAHWQYDRERMIREYLEWFDELAAKKQHQLLKKRASG